MRVRRGAIARGLLICIYGKVKMGKTTLACSAPNPIVLSGEGGDFGLTARAVIEFDSSGRTVPESFDEAMSALNDAVSGGLPEDGKTLVIDGFGAIEYLAEKKTLAKYKGKKKDAPQIKSLKEDWQDPHAWRHNYMRELMATLQAITQRGINVILVCHEDHVSTDDEESGKNRKIVPRLCMHRYDNNVALITETCDIVGYMWQAQREDGSVGKGEHAKTVYTPTDKRTLTVRPEGRAWLCGLRVGLEHLSTDFVIPKPPASGFDKIARQVAYAMLDEAKLTERLLGLNLPAERKAKLAAYIETKPSALDMRIALVKEEE